jgi:hypothetical protein
VFSHKSAVCVATLSLRVVRGDKKGTQVSDETVKYGYWALITRLVSDYAVNYRPVFPSEKTPTKEE